MKIQNRSKKLLVLGEIIGLSLLMTAPLMAIPYRPGYSFWQRPTKVLYESTNEVTITSILKDDNFDTLASKLEETGLIEDLETSKYCNNNQPCRLTIFAPTNEAFANLSPEDSQKLAEPGMLKKVLEYHLITHELQPEEIPGTISTATGQTLTVTVKEDDPDEFWINNQVKVTSTKDRQGNSITPFQFANNGIVIPVNKIIFPPKRNW